MMASEQFKKKVAKGEFDQTTAEQMLKNVFLYANLKDLNANQKDVKILPPIMFNLVTNFHSRTKHNMIIDDQMSSGKTIEDVIKGIDILVGNPEDAYNFLSKLDIVVSHSITYLPVIETTHDGKTKIQWTNPSEGKKSTDPTIILDYLP
jgi:hypothetical protein